MTRILGFHSTVNTYQLVVSSSLYHAIGLLRPQLINTCWYHFTVFDVHKRCRTLREMVTVSGYDPRAVFELLLNTAQFELKLKEVCYFLWTKWIVQVCLSSAKVQYGHLSWVWVLMQKVSFSQSSNDIPVLEDVYVYDILHYICPVKDIWWECERPLVISQKKWFDISHLTFGANCCWMVVCCLLSWTQINF